MRTSLLSTLAATVVVTAIATPAAAGPAGVGPLALASGPSPFAGCTVGGPGTNYVNTEVEPWVAVNPANPANVIGVYQQDRWSNGGARGLVTAASFDGGATWVHSFPPLSTCAGADPALGYDRSSDPWVSIGPDGRAYQVSISFSADQSISAVLASTSGDGGLTWSAPATIRRTVNGPLNDKESVTADPRRAGTAYVVWDQPRFPSDSASSTALQHSFAFRGDAWFSKTTDGGQTWSAPRDITLNQNVSTLGNQIVVEPDGTLIDVYQYLKGSGIDQPNVTLIGFSRSTDGGATWTPPKVIADNTSVTPVDPETGKPLRTGSDTGGSIPDAAVDPQTGALYVVWEDARFSGTYNDIALSKSTNEGKTWSNPVKVNQSPPGVFAFTPAVDVLSDGTVGVSYYDIRNNTPAPGLLTDYFFVHSHDGGVSWAPDARVTPTSFDEEWAPFARGYFLGDYEGLAHTGSAFVAFFAQTNTDLANRTDVFGVTITT